MEIKELYKQKYKKQKQETKGKRKVRQYNPEAFAERKCKSTGYKYIRVRYEVNIPIGIATDQKRHSKSFSSLDKAINFCEYMGIEYK